MNDERIERSVRSAVASIEMEGLHVDPSCVVLCVKMLKGEISMEQYIASVVEKIAASRVFSSFCGCMRNL